MNNKNTDEKQQVEKVLPERLKLLRQSIKKNQGEIAASLHISRQLYNYYENGKRLPDVSMVLRIAAFYHVSVDYLLGNSENPLNPEEMADLPPDFLLQIKSSTHQSIKEMQQIMGYLEARNSGQLASGEKK